MAREDPPWNAEQPEGASSHSITAHEAAGAVAHHDKAGAQRGMQPRGRFLRLVALDRYSRELQHCPVALNRHCRELQHRLCAGAATRALNQPWHRTVGTRLLALPPTHPSHFVGPPCPSSCHIGLSTYYCNYRLAIPAACHAGANEDSSELLRGWQPPPDPHYHHRGGPTTKRPLATRSV